MLTHDDIPDLDLSLRQLRIITGALIGGVASFGTVVVATGSFNQPPAGPEMSIIGAAGAILAVVLHFVVPAVVARKAIGTPSTGAVDTQRLLGIYQTKQIIGLALLEGAAFFNLVCCMVEHNLWSAGIVIALVLLMLSKWPTRTRVLQWIEAQQMSRDFR